MTGPLTYPPEIVIESKIDLPPEFWQEGTGMSIEVYFDLALLIIEIVTGLLEGM